MDFRQASEKPSDLSVVIWSGIVGTWIQMLD